MKDRFLRASSRENPSQPGARLRELSSSSSLDSTSLGLRDRSLVDWQMTRGSESTWPRSMRRSWGAARGSASWRFVFWATAGEGWRGRRW